MIVIPSIIDASCENTLLEEKISGKFCLKPQQLLISENMCADL